MTVLIAPNIKKVSERLDKSGNIIDPRTRQIVEKKEEYVAPQPVVQKPVFQTTTEKIQTKDEAMSLQEVKEEISYLEKRLESMKTRKKLLVEELKKLLEDDL